MAHDEQVKGKISNIGNTFLTSMTELSEGLSNGVG